MSLFAITTMAVALYEGIFSGFSLGLNDRAQCPVVLFSALSFFLSALSFFQRPVIFREPFGFFGFSSALFWAWSCRKRPIKAKGGVIFVHHVVICVGHRRHLGFTMNINLCKLVRPVVFQDQLEHCIFNPFTPKSDQCQISPAASPAILHHTVWRTSLFIAYSHEIWLYYQFWLHHLYIFSLRGWENVLFELGSERVKVSRLTLQKYRTSLTFVNIYHHNMCCHRQCIKLAYQ